MGRKGGWFSSVKKALSPNSKAKKVEKGNKSNTILLDKEKPPVSQSANPEPVVEVSHPQPRTEDVKLIEAENEQSQNTSSVAVASASAPAVQAASEVARLTKGGRFTGKSKEDIAAIKIQTAFRGYLARRALRALRGLVRLRSLVDGPTVKRQSANTLKCMQTLSRVQSQIQSRRIRMLEENRALQRQLLQKRAKELESLRMGEEWDDSVHSKEQIEASLLHKYEAAMRRERALAYSYTHQQTWKKSAKSTNLLFTDPTNPHWGWSWLERLTAAGPCDTQSPSEKDANFDRMSVKSAGPGNITTGEITKSFARHQLNSETPSSPSSAQRRPSKTIPSSPARKSKPASPKWGPISQDDESRSVFSVRSERKRRHSIGVSSSSVRDDESLASCQSIVPSYMTPTRSTEAKLKSSSPLGMENGGPNEKGSKKRLSYPPSPATARRHSGPPKVGTRPFVENDVDANGVGR